MNDQNDLSVQPNQKTEAIIARHRTTLDRINIQPLGTTCILVHSHPCLGDRNVECFFAECPPFEIDWICEPWWSQSKNTPHSVAVAISFHMQIRRLTFYRIDPLLHMSITETRRQTESEKNRGECLLREIHRRCLDVSSNVRYFARCGCPCSPLCLWLSLLATIILLAALGTTLVALLTGSRARTTTTETSISQHFCSL